MQHSVRKTLVTVLYSPWITGNPKVFSSPVELVQTNALVFLNVRVVG